MIKIMNKYQKTNSCSSSASYNSTVLINYIKLFIKNYNNSKSLKHKKLSKYFTIDHKIQEIREKYLDDIYYMLSKFDIITEMKEMEHDIADKVFVKTIIKAFSRLKVTINSALGDVYKEVRTIQPTFGLCRDIDLRAKRFNSFDLVMHLYTNIIKSILLYDPDLKNDLYKPGFKDILYVRRRKDIISYYILNKNKQ
jgi:hypothetical protein